MKTTRRMLTLSAVIAAALGLIALVRADGPSTPPAQPGQPGAPGHTGSQAIHLPTPGRVPADPGDPANSYPFGPAHTTGRTGTNSPFAVIASNDLDNGGGTKPPFAGGDTGKDDNVTSYHFTMGVVCWIDNGELPFITPIDSTWTGADLAGLTWWNRVAIGLVGTANEPPPDNLENLDAFYTKTSSRWRQYRTILWCDVLVKVDRNDQVADCKIMHQVLDPGWTPPFDGSKVALGPAIVAIGPFIGVPEDNNWYTGEASPVSAIYYHRHPNSTLGPLAGNEQLVLDGLMKFRAGTHTDVVGIERAHSLYHVPWMWTEMMLTYRGHGAFGLYGSGSIFPSQAWYFNGQKVHTQLQDKLELNDHQVALTIGAPASGLQVSQEDSPRQDGPVSGHRYTMPAPGLAPWIDDFREDGILETPPSVVPSKKA